MDFSFTDVSSLNIFPSNLCITVPLLFLTFSFSMSSSLLMGFESLNFLNLFFHFLCTYFSIFSPIFLLFLYPTIPLFFLLKSDTLGIYLYELVLPSCRVLFTLAPLPFEFSKDRSTLALCFCDCQTLCTGPALFFSPISLSYAVCPLFSSFGIPVTSFVQWSFILCLFLSLSCAAIISFFFLLLSLFSSHYLCLWYFLFLDGCL